MIPSRSPDWDWTLASRRCTWNGTSETLQKVMSVREREEVFYFSVKSAAEWSRGLRSCLVTRPVCSVLSPYKPKHLCETFPITLCTGCYPAYTVQMVLFRRKKLLVSILSVSKLGSVLRVIGHLRQKTMFWGRNKSCAPWGLLLSFFLSW